MVGSQHHEVSGGLNQALAASWDHALLPRSCFDDTKGILAVQEATGCSAEAFGTAGAGPTGAQDSAGNSSSSGGVGLRALVKSHYLGFGAAGALLHHLRHNLRLALTPHAVQVSYWEYAGIACWISPFLQLCLGTQLSIYRQSRISSEKGCKRFPRTPGCAMSFFENHVQQCQADNQRGCPGAWLSTHAGSCTSIQYDGSVLHLQLQVGQPWWIGTAAVSCMHVWSSVGVQCCSCNLSALAG